MVEGEPGEVDREVHGSIPVAGRADAVGGPWYGPLTAAVPPLLWPAIGFLALFYVFPVLQMLLLSITEPRIGLDNFVHILTTPLYARVLANTFQISLTVAVLCLMLGYPTAYLLVVTPKRLSNILMILVLVPFFTSVLVRTYAWIFLLGSNGIINQILIGTGMTDSPVMMLYSRFAVIVGMVHVLLPYMVLVLYSVMQGIDRQLTSAAQSLSAAPFTAFRRVFLPLSLPGVFSGSILVFVMALAFFVTPTMLGSPKETMIANLVSHQVNVLQWGLASALGAVLLLCSMVALGMMQHFFGGLGIMTGSSARTVSRTEVREGALVHLLDRVFATVWRIGTPVIAGLVLAFLFVPLTVMVPLSVNPSPYFSFPPAGLSLVWYGKYLGSADWMEATWHSVQIALMTSVLSMLLALPAALAISRSTSRAALAFYALLISPMIVPAIIVAIAVSFLLAQMHLIETTFGVALGQTIGALPLATVVLVAALRNFDRNLERAALSLGASPLRATYKVVLPVIAPAVWTAAFFAFLHSFDELLVALFVSGVEARTLPKKMWESLQEVDPTIAAVSTLLVAVSVLVLAAIRCVQSWARRGAARRRDFVARPNAAG